MFSKIAETRDKHIAESQCAHCLTEQYQDANHLILSRLYFQQQFIQR